VEVQHRHRDGTLRWVEIRASLLAEETGRPVGILGVSRDISERKRADQLYQAKMAAEAASVAKSGFLANMSHELRTPLNHIMGFTELILDGTFGELNDAQAEHLRDVYRSSEHLLSLVNEILDMGRIEAGRMEISPAEVRLGPLLEESLSIIRDRALKRRIEVRAQFDRIPATVVADERRLRQILYNLLANAVKFTPEGGHLRLAARVLEGAGEASSGRGARSELEISVADSGIGISAEDLEKIFDPFTQVESSLSRRFPGSGLGLTLARTLVQLHGGRIWAESDGPGRGATFRFTLPL
jgi:signal transduction histidine kinase